MIKKLTILLLIFFCLDSIANEVNSELLKLNKEIAIAAAKAINIKKIVESNDDNNKKKEIKKKYDIYIGEVNKAKNLNELKKIQGSETVFVKNIIDANKLCLDKIKSEEVLDKNIISICKKNTNFIVLKNADNEKVKINEVLIENKSPKIEVINSLKKLIDLCSSFEKNNILPNDSSEICKNIRNISINDKSEKPVNLENKKKQEIKNELKTELILVNSHLLVMYISLCVAAFFAVLFLYNQRKLNKMTEEVDALIAANLASSLIDGSESKEQHNVEASMVDPSENPNVNLDVQSTGTSVSDVKISDTWKLFAISKQGKDHLRKTPTIPCQDSHCMKVIDDKWGVAVVCDGAGSQIYSHYGSKFVANEIAEHFASWIPTTQIYKTNQLPKDNDWNEYCKLLIKQTRDKLDVFVDKMKSEESTKGIGIRDVGCTIIWVIYTPIGLLTGHVGDGRAGYKDINGWHSMMTPWEGEYSNITVFINTDMIYANKFENLTDPSKPFLETKVIHNNQISAFILMSDGCEKGLYETVVYDKSANANIRINKPHANNCDSIVDVLSKVLKTTPQDCEVKARQLFEEIVDRGNDALEKEGDDKTLVLGFLNK